MPHFKVSDYVFKYRSGRVSCIDGLEQVCNLF